jgi:hypothetical protein
MCCSTCSVQHDTCDTSLQAQTACTSPRAARSRSGSCALLTDVCSPVAAAAGLDDMVTLAPRCCVLLDNCARAANALALRERQQVWRLSGSSNSNDRSGAVTHVVKLAAPGVHVQKMLLPIAAIHSNSIMCNCRTHTTIARKLAQI